MNVQVVQARSRIKPRKRVWSAAESCDGARSKRRGPLSRARRLDGFISTNQATPTPGVHDKRSQAAGPFFRGAPPRPSSYPWDGVMNGGARTKLSEYRSGLHARSPRSIRPLAPLWTCSRSCSAPAWPQGRRYVVRRGGRHAGSALTQGTTGPSQVCSPSLISSVHQRPPHPGPAHCCPVPTARRPPSRCAYYIVPYMQWR